MAELKNFYLVTFSGEGISVAKKLQDEGVKVCVHQIKDCKDILTKQEKYKPEDPEEKKRRLTLGDGLVEKITEGELKSRLEKADPKTSFVFVDFNHCFKLSEELKKYGLPGMYPTEADRLLEVDRQKAKDFVKKNYPDISLPETHEFKTAAEAEIFLEGTDKAFVLKGFDEDAKTVVPDTDDPEMAKEQVLEALEGDKTLYEKSGFVLEEKIPKPVEITPEALFCDGKLLSVTVDLELKRFGAGDTGPMTGCAADLVFPVSKTSDIAKMAFPSAVSELAKKHKGMFVWDASLLFAKDGKPYFGEFCADRVGYNCFFTQLEICGAKHFFEAVMEGKDPYADGPNFGASVRIFNVHKEEGRPASDMDIEGDIWTLDAKADEDEDMETCGYLMDVGVVTGSGDTVEMALKRAEMKAGEVNFREKYYRPLLDAMSRKYPGAIVNRFAYGKKKGLW